MAVLPACRLGLVVCVATAVITATMVLATPSYACACGAAVTAHGSQATLNHEVALLHWERDDRDDRHAAGNERRYRQRCLGSAHPPNDDPYRQVVTVYDDVALPPLLLVVVSAIAVGAAGGAVVVVLRRRRRAHTG